MKRLIALLLVLLSFIMLVTAASAGDGSDDDEKDNAYFVGLWEGVDPNDGSRRMISISDNDGDGVFELVQYDTFWTLCGNDIRGIAQGSGTVNNTGNLEWAGTLTCFDDPMKQVDFRVDYEPVEQSDILVERAVGLPLAPDILHRVSTRGDD